MVVTARLRTEDVQKVPGAVSVVIRPTALFAVNHSAPATSNVDYDRIVNIK